MHELAAVLPYKLIQIVITFKDKRILVLPHLPTFYRKEDRSGGEKETREVRTMREGYVTLRSAGLE